MSSSLFFAAHAVHGPANQIGGGGIVKKPAVQSSVIAPALSENVSFFYYILAMQELVPDMSVEVFNKVQDFDIFLSSEKGILTSPIHFFESAVRILQKYDVTVAVELVKQVLKQNHILLHDIVSKSKRSVLHQACQENNKEVVDLIFRVAGDDAGKLIFLRDKSGWSPLHIAVYQGYVDIVEMILKVAEKTEHPYDVLVLQSHKGHTSLHVAVGVSFPHERIDEQRYLKIISLLLASAYKSKRLADFLRMPNKKGETAEVRAGYCRFIEAEKLLQQAENEGKYVAEYSEALG